MASKMMGNSIASEEALCTAFADVAREHGWTVYPETGGWDLLLVRRAVQVGIQAKAMANIHSFTQALPPDPRKIEPGPTYRAVLWGRVAGRTAIARGTQFNLLSSIAIHLKLLVILHPEDGGRWRLWGTNLRCGHRAAIDWRHYRWRAVAPVWTPPFIPDNPAGVPSPRTVSKWMVAAVWLERIYHQRGWVCLDTARDVTDAVGGGWRATTLLNRFYRTTALKSDINPRQAQWVARPRVSPASACYPVVYAEMTFLKLISLYGGDR